MKELTAANVNETFFNCLFNDDESHENFVKGEGIIQNFGFHPERLKNNKQDIKDYLSQLPHTFREDEGGGWSFLQACCREDGVHWAEHRTMEQLFALGQAIGAVQCLLPREMWPALPGGMPYYVIKSDKKEK